MKPEGNITTLGSGSMAANRDPEARQRMMLDTPMHKLIPAMAIPTIIAMFISSIYSLTDAWFISSLGVEAIGAIGINVTIDNIIMMAGSFLALGANSYIARLLGAGDNKKASNVLATSFYTALMTGTLVLILGFSFREPMVRFFGATETIAPHAIDYASFVLISAPIQAAIFVLNHCLRSEGSAKLAMVGMVSGAVMNVILDYFFIMVLGWGLRGASAATAIARLVTFCVLLQPYLSGRSVLSLRIRNIRYNRDIITEVFKMGCPSLFRLAASTLAAIVTNRIAGGFSDSALAAISLTNRIMMFMVSLSLGFGQGFQPVAGFNWGAKRYDRVHQGFWFSIKVLVVVMTALSTVMFIFAPQVIALFDQSGSPDMVRIASLALRFICAVMPMEAWVVISTMCFSGIGRAFGSAVLSLSRQFICLIPVLLVLPPLFGETGLAASQATADVMAFVISLPLMIGTLRLLRRRMAEQEQVTLRGNESHALTQDATGDN